MSLTNMPLEAETNNSIELINQIKKKKICILQIDEFNTVMAIKYDADKSSILLHDYWGDKSYWWVSADLLHDAKIIKMVDEENFPKEAPL